MTDLLLCRNSNQQDSKQTQDRPWFTIYNQYYGPQQTFSYLFHPFPVDEFPPDSPWENCIVIAHFGIEPFAAAAGFTSVDKYLMDLIRDAATRKIK